MRYPNIEAELARAGMSRTELAAALHVTRKTLYNWLHSKKGIPSAKLDLMAELLGCDPVYLIAQPQPKEPMYC